MKKPEMVLFDYGHTLVHETHYDPLQGAKALLPHITKNPRGVTAEDISALYTEMVSHIDRGAHTLNQEVPFASLARTLCTLLEIETSLSPRAFQTVFWDGLAPGKAMPGVDAVLGDLALRGVRTGVISNISFSGEALAHRIGTLLPGHSFEFIIASCDYGFRTPQPYLFRAALHRAGLPAEDVWYCGDNTRVDILGASAMGMYPVWFEYEQPCIYRDATSDEAPPCAHHHIQDWPAFLPLMDQLS